MEKDDNNEGEDITNVMDGLPDYVIHRVDKLKQLDQKREEFMSDYLKERATLEAKYQAMCDTLYSERAQIVKGEKDIDGQQMQITDEMGPMNKAEKKSENAMDIATEQIGSLTVGSNNEQDNHSKGIPQFWVCAMGHMESIGSLLEEEDIDCLEYLQDITCVDDADGKGFTLKFWFKPNPYFENAELTKKYEVPNLLMGDEPVLKNVKGCEIRWKPDRSLTFEIMKKKQKGKGKHAGQVRTVLKQERKESFFHWFQPPVMPALEDMNEELALKLEEMFEQDFDVAQAFRQNIVPKAVQWFTGEIVQEDLDSAVNTLLSGN